MATFKSLDQIKNPQVRASAERQLLEQSQNAFTKNLENLSEVARKAPRASTGVPVESSATDASLKPQNPSRESGLRYVFELDPVSKPRMTQRDKWLKPARKCVAEYWSFKDQLVSMANKQGFVMPEANYHLVFYLGMPKSWSSNKKVAYEGEPHRQKPDKDNLEKAVLDALLKDDSKVWDGRVSKYWSKNPRIEVLLSH